MALQSAYVYTNIVLLNLIEPSFQTAPQTNADNRVLNLSSGKILGGDSAVNGLVWVRGAKEEYDAIEALGNSGWNWQRFYAAMKKSEAVKTSAALKSEFGYAVTGSSLGASGPVDVSFPCYLPMYVIAAFPFAAIADSRTLFSQHQKFITASTQLGHKFNADPYGGDNRGIFYSLASQTRAAVRESSEFAYLASRSNLIVLYDGALAAKLNVTANPGVASTSTQAAVATGVQVRFPDNTVQIAKLKPSTGEVILSAGTIRTPQLLELSGIGDRDVLSRVGINTLVHLPGVGANFEDHTITVLTYKLKQPYLSFDALEYDPALLAAQESLYRQGQGWLTFANSVINMAPVDNILTPAEITTAKQILQSKPPTIQKDLYNSIKDRIFNVPQVEYLLFNSFSAGTKKEANRSYVSMIVAHMHPLSRGSIHIRTTSIDDQPIINPNVLEAEWDRWLMTKATAYARKFFQTPAFQEVFEEEVWPTPALVNNDAQWETFVKDNIGSGYHAVGTASLLPQAKGGVVDTNLKIYGYASCIRTVIHIANHFSPAAPRTSASPMSRFFPFSSPHIPK
ncbi:hypothetical protein H0H81_006922 [Sphagnurus paluster]|uniref:Glucose-methanol-choline oxidoreductase N-terminal domain-containing protein n=1 Tax=Sphagnurus paluster TaxID=117069 RepID=A0A9P7FTH7_9AGAR|nr:hypothetical protein H0H81_006922 [Sphagnurus paluster]